MNQEDKELLLKDLCARLMHGVKVRYSSYKEFVNCTLHSINPVYDNVDLWSKSAYFSSVSISKIKPYLFPLSSMTEEQKQYLKNRFCYDWDGEPYDLWKYQIEIGDADGLIDWFNKNHFDYRGLIEKSLAIDATNLNVY